MATILIETAREHPLLSAESIRFYRQALSILTEARLVHGTMSEADIAQWTAGIAIDGSK